MKVLLFCLFMMLSKSILKYKTLDQGNGRYLNDDKTQKTNKFEKLNKQWQEDKDYKNIVQSIKTNIEIFKDQDLTPEELSKDNAVDKIKDKLLNFEPEENQLAYTYVLLMFTQAGFMKFSNLKNLIYYGNCKVDIKQNKEFDQPPEINYQFYKILLNKVQNWFVYYKNLNENFATSIDFENQKINPQEIPSYSQVKEDVKKILDENYDKASQGIQDIYKHMIYQYDFMNCGMSDMLNFYSLIPRFTYIMDQIPENEIPKVIELKMGDLYNEKKKFMDVILNTIFHRVYFIFFWDNIMRRLKFLVDQPNVSDIALDKSLAILIKATDSVNYSVQQLVNLNRQIDVTFDSIKLKLNNFQNAVDRNNQKLRDRTIPTLDEILIFQKEENTYKEEQII